MRCQCSYCSIIYDLKPPMEDDSVSTGICPECWIWVENNIEIELAQIEESQTIPEGSHIRPNHPSLAE